MHDSHPPTPAAAGVIDPHSTNPWRRRAFRLRPLPLGRGARLARLNWRELAAGAVVPFAIVALWQLSATLGWVNPQVLPAPLEVVQKWIEYLLPAAPWDPASASWLGWALSGELPGDALSSMYRVVLGFAIGAGLALPLGLTMGSNARVYAWLNPLMQVLRPIPPIAYIPLAILWFGLGNAPALFLIALGAFFPVLMNTIAGVRHVDGIYLRAARNLGVNQRTLFLRVMLPASVPYILSGVRIGIGTAFIVVIVSEMIAVNNGLGFRILEAREYFWSAKIIAGMISIGMLGLIIDIGMNRLNNYLLRWHRGLEN
jgi:NitT/TauT family transport system permease protein